MANIILPDNHYFLKVSSDVTHICLPLFKHYKLSIFVYGRYYNDGKCLLLCNNRDWIQHHLKMGYSAPAPISKELLIKPESFNIITDKGSFSKAKHEILKLFNADQAIDIIYKNKDSYEVFCFSFLPEIYDAINVFMNYLDSFRKFCFFFKDKAAKILKGAQNKAIILPAEMRGLPKNDKVIDYNSVEKLKFKKEIITKKYTFSTDFGDYNFSGSEVKCLIYLLRGYSIADSAKLLNLSPRTLESYLENIKSKVGCSKKSEVIDYFTNLDYLRKLVD